MKVDLREAAGITSDLSRDELEMQAALFWGDLAYEKDENRHLRKLCREMFNEHKRLYYTQGVLRGSSATSTQMAHWYSELVRWGIEVDG